MEKYDRLDKGIRASEGLMEREIGSQLVNTRKTRTGKIMHELARPWSSDVNIPKGQRGKDYWRRRKASITTMGQEARAQWDDNGRRIRS